MSGQPSAVSRQLVTSAAEWQEAITQMPVAHPLQSWAWGAFKSRWRWSALRLVWRGEEGRPLAAAMVLKRRTPGLPFSILYVPKGPLLAYEDEQRREMILGQLELLARRERAILIKIDPDVVVSWGLEEEEMVSSVGAAWIEALQVRGWRFSADQVQFRNTVEVDLTLSEDELLAAMKQKTRYNIRLAERKGVMVRPGTEADLPAIFTMYQETAARDGFVIRPAAYYLDGWGSLMAAGMAQPLVAEVEGEPVAAIIVVHDGDKALYMVGASTEKERQRMPNYLLQWEGIRLAKRLGCQVYDFWGAPDDFVESDSMWGVWRFKAGFGGQVVRHIGAWDYAARPFWVWLYTAVIPSYLEALKIFRR